MEKNSNCETALTWTPEGKRKVGRPKTTWRSTIENERSILGWNSWNEARRVAADRTRWRRFTSALWATGPEEDRMEDSFLGSLEMYNDFILNFHSTIHIH